MILRKMGRFPDSRPKEKIRLALQDLEGFEFIWVPWITAVSLDELGSWSMVLKNNLCSYNSYEASFKCLAYVQKNQAPPICMSQILLYGGLFFVPSLYSDFCFPASLLFCFPCFFASQQFCSFCFSASLLFPAFLLNRP